MIRNTILRWKMRRQMKKYVAEMARFQSPPINAKNRRD